MRILRGGARQRAVFEGKGPLEVRDRQRDSHLRVGRQVGKKSLRREMRQKILRKSYEKIQGGGQLGGSSTTRRGGPPAQGKGPEEGYFRNQ